ncbi:hypothetical protein [Asticcacaulis sp. AND118]|uniref:hypothetical protein n=1 Tax=Asticcacaulis sp. AND118 TaxID=2840468 RepID=UPI001CFF5EEF|nr:hypothetical protein [Asticcacaulis sp. AND118]UDF04247.1 hypothetical protein LH365_04180 [Asticcacaulis sp. AND118]
MDGLSHPEPTYARDYTAPGQPIRTARNAAEWSALVLSVLGLAGFGIYVFELLVGMFG